LSPTGLNRATPGRLGRIAQQSQHASLREDFAEAVEVLKASPVAVPHPMRQLAASAARLAIDLGHPAYDCFYLAVAVQEQYSVITADRRFHDIARKHPYP
jgi:predicted nucleic acid-binding protein